MCFMCAQLVEIFYHDCFFSDSEIDLFLGHIYMGTHLAFETPALGTGTIRNGLKLILSFRDLSPLSVYLGRQ